MSESELVERYEAKKLAGEDLDEDQFLHQIGSKRKKEKMLDWKYDKMININIVFSQIYDFN